VTLGAAFTVVRSRHGKSDLGSITTFPNKDKGTSSGITFDQDMQDVGEIVIRIVTGELSLSLKKVLPEH
jgi:hypothetical protein